MEVAAQDPLDLRMTGDHRGETGGVFQPELVHVVDAGDKGRVVHHDQGRPIGRAGERAVEPVEALGAQFTMVFARHQRVERDQPQRIILDRILDKTVA